MNQPSAAKTSGPAPASSDPQSPAHSARRQDRRRRQATVFSAAVALVCTVLTAAILYPFLFRLESTGPGFRTGHYLLAWLLLILAINRALAILQARLEGVGTKRFVFITMCALCIFVPPKIISLVERAVVVGYAKLVPQQSAPTIAAINQVLSQSTEDIREALHGRRVSHWIESVTVDAQPRTFAITARFPSIDIDGYTIWYNSEDERWRYYHNDSQEALEDRARPVSKKKRQFMLICERRTSGKLHCWGDFQPAQEDTNTRVDGKKEKAVSHRQPRANAAGVPGTEFREHLT